MFFFSFELKNNHVHNNGRIHVIGHLHRLQFSIKHVFVRFKKEIKRCVETEVNNLIKLHGCQITKNV